MKKSTYILIVGFILIIVSRFFHQMELKQNIEPEPEQEEEPEPVLKPMENSPKTTSQERKNGENTIENTEYNSEPETETEPEPDEIPQNILDEITEANELKE